MHEKNSSSHNRESKLKGYHLPHYQGSDSPSAMRHPAWDKLPDQLPNLATVESLGERAASDPELIRLIQAYNEAPGRLPETHNRTLLEGLPGEDAESRDAVLATMKTHDEDSNGVVYLRCDKFVYASELCNLINGRDDLKNGRSSKQVISEYKNMPHDTMPPVQHVKAYYEEATGNTFYALVGDGSHRLAGAAMRGDEYIPATSVSFVHLETNVISERLEQLSFHEEERKSQRRRFGHGILQSLGIRTLLT
jgi:hypothetical protein